MNESKSWFLIFSCWLIATFSMLGSLFFSEVMEFPPCSMCWYQRIAMYPLVLIFLVALFPLDKRIIKYASPFVLIGLLLSFWHNLLHWGIIPESVTPCREGIPCSTVYLDYGFLTIPLLSLLAFIFISILLTTFYNITRKTQ